MATLNFLSDMHVEITPKIYKGYNQDDLGDAPDQHRWRAQWSDADDRVDGIRLVAHPVVSVTPRGAWIDQHAWRERRADGLGWHLSGSKRWVSNDGGQAWAKPTQEAALLSIAVRLHRWSQKLYHEIQRLHAAAEVLKVLRPQDQSYAHRAIETMRAGSAR
jgi:hypothetical protein